MPVDQKIWLLVSLKLSGEATPDELAQLDMLLEIFPDLKLQAEVLSTIWNAGPKGQGINKEEALARHLQRMNNIDMETLPPDETGGKQKPAILKRPAVSSWQWMAAAVCIFLGVAGIKYLPELNNHNGPSHVSHLVTTRPGHRMQLKLPDGTSVWMNASSSISYSGDFEGHLREVRLSGEAFFDVAPDNNRPFVIHTNTIDVRVLGTAFNIRSYDDEKETETALIRGAVEVTLRNDPGKKIILKPKEKILINNNRCDSANNLATPKQSEESPLIVLSKIRYWGRDSSNNLESAWVRNRLVFDKETLTDIAGKIERWYNVKINISDSRISESRYTGNFENEKLEEVLEALRLTGGFHYSIKENTVTINQ
ncbi:FecR family protein [Chitinophaga sp. Cy-1792]|uniref:FecR family protein n=1 Tax=Chitinophaga sp. Cy-1792 TaxID=2608339 RepID=UPI001421E92F|nr:FecR domain-containing protein [Chitinophaga sp. Cy-1792]NIG55039.1 DUF4974 domain-containing protein [Chitinophaga sp. Cy-1792]